MGEVATLEQVTSLALGLSPLEQLKLVERLVNFIEREWLVRESPTTSLHAWQKVYEGFSDEELVEVENVVRERNNFMY